VSDVPVGDIDTAITLCAEECVVPPGRDLRRESWSMRDPAQVAGSDADKLTAFREVRDELRRRIEALLPGRKN
jgi:arsenate reductase